MQIQNGREQKNGYIIKLKIVQPKSNIHSAHSLSLRKVFMQSILRGIIWMSLQWTWSNVVFFLFRSVCWIEVLLNGRVPSTSNKWKIIIIFKLPSPTDVIWQMFINASFCNPFLVRIYCHRLPSTRLNDCITRQWLSLMNWSVSVQPRTNCSVRTMYSVDVTVKW